MKRLLIASISLVVIWMLLSPVMLSAYAGLGGYVSEKLLGGAGGADSSLYLSNGTGVMVLGTAPLITTLPATGISATNAGGIATLNGNIASLNGMPSANMWFEWGYATSALTNVTPTINTMLVGGKSAIVSGFSNSETVYYRIVSSTDSVGYGNIENFVAGSTNAIALFNFMNLFPMLLGVVFLFWAARQVANAGGNSLAVIIVLIVGFYLVVSVLSGVQSNVNNLWGG